MAQRALRLTPLPNRLAVCKLPPRSPLPAWATAGAFWSVTAAADELSIVCDAALAPPDVQAERDWRALAVEGPLDFALVGVLHAITGPLAAAAISLFAISTFNTDYVLVRERAFAAAVVALRAAGHSVAENVAPLDDR